MKNLVAESLRPKVTQVDTSYRPCGGVCQFELDVGLVRACIWLRLMNEQYLALGVCFNRDLFGEGSALPVGPSKGRPDPRA